MPEDDDSAEKFRIDRVYIPPRGRGKATVTSVPYTRPTRTSAPPPDANADVELALRRQLSRLQRQLAEAQSELANKDDELAAEITNRKLARETYDTLIEEQRQKGELLADLVSAQVRVTALEQEAHRGKSSVDELGRALARETALRLAAQTRLDELGSALEDAQIRAKEERAKLDSQRLVEVSALEAQVRLALDAAQTAATQATARVADAHAAEIAEVKAGHARSLAALRGELEPKAVEARELAAEREKIASEMAAVRLESARDAASRDEAHVREMSQHHEAHARELAQIEAARERERATVEAERDQHATALQQVLSRAGLREKELDHDLSAARDARARLDSELATMKVRCAWLESEKAAADDRHGAALREQDARTDEVRDVREQLEAAQAEVRRGVVDRQRFVAYLEQGLALVGALPPSEPKS